MKKLLSIVIVGSLLTATCVWAEMEWTPLNIAITPKISLFKNPIVTGLDFGVLGTQSKEVYGIQFSPLWNSVEDYIYGIQAGIINYRSLNTYGIQFGFVNNMEIFSDKKAEYKLGDITTYGFQVSAINLTGTLYGCQAGFMNISEESHGIQIGVVNSANRCILQVAYLINACFHDENTGIQFAWLSNASETGKGLQLSFFNFAGDYKGGQIGIMNACVSKEYIFRGTGDYQGIQIGMFNLCSSLKGIQIGIINYTESLKGIQLGIINTAINSPIFSTLPIVNARF